MSSAPSSPDRRQALLDRVRLLDEQATRLAEKNLHSFIRQAWPIVEPKEKFLDNWHIGAKAEHLSAIVDGRLGKPNLLINEPPGFSKSLVVSVFFPAWCWTRNAASRFICTSFDQTLSSRDNWRMRQLVESSWYQARWGHRVSLATDQNQKTFYRTTAGGWRMGTSFGSRIAGDHPNGKIIDDPHDTKRQLLSDTEVRKAIDYYQGGLKPRGAVIDAWTVLLMQRIHQSDLTGWILENEPEDWYHLCLPMRWEPKRMVVLPPLNWHDPREGHPGALLDPRRFPVERIERTYPPGSWVEAAQCQQRPVPVGGLMFKREQFQIIHAMPQNVIGRCRAWDVAGTTEVDKTSTSARTAGVRLEATSDGLFIIVDVRKGWWSAHEVEQQMLQTARVDGPDVPIREEREGGSSGKAVIAAHRRLLAGYSYGEIGASRDKALRATGMQAQAQGGNMRILVPLLPDGTLDPHAQKMAKEFLDEIELFPAGTLKDQVDAAVHAFNALTGISQPLDITTGAPQDVELTEAELEARAEELRVESERVVLDEIARNGVYWPGEA